ncbi:MAG: hypothetical protein PCFJNLEI_00237 [Verrucomicrobiae bacterium]|nr:hypothetical protein [Verrucomicrobiae bacterium]
MILVVVAVVSLIVAGVVIGKRYLKPSGPGKFGIGVVGEVAAEEIVRLLGGRGQVVVVFLNPKSTGLKGPERIVQKLESRLKREPGLQLLPRESVSAVEPNSSRRCAELVRQYSNVDAVVLVGGVGQVYAHDFAELAGSSRKLVSILAFGLAESRDLLQQSVLSLAIVDHPEPPPVLADGPSGQEWFAARYLALTPQTAGQIQIQPPPATRDSGPN